MTAISLNTLPDPEVAKRSAQNRRSVAEKLRIIREVKDDELLFEDYPGSSEAQRELL